MAKKFWIGIILILNLQNAYGAHLYKERDYQKHWCDRFGGVMEFKNPDNTRIDCLTDKYAIEFDFASKWAESAGQALYYALLTGKKPAMVLILENKEYDFKNIARARVLSKKYKIKLRVVGAELARQTNF